MPHEIVLAGCMPVPLAGYLKALGVLRLVAEQADAEAQGWWQDEVFHLRSRLDRDGLLHFLLHDYQPTPIVAPWNGGSGFYAHRETAADAVAKLRHSQADRLARYRATIRAVDGVMARLGLAAKPKDDSKDALIAACRNWLPDDAVAWLDAVLVLTPDGASFPPLLGTGGNDGNLEFTNNFMQRLADVMDPVSGRPDPNAGRWLAGALFGEAIHGLMDVSIGQFAPGSAGGPNAAAGFSGGARVNPWEYILMLEGALMFSASATKRLERGHDALLSYPFTVKPSAAGFGGIALEDEASARAEMWLPIWHFPARYPELTAVFREGRAQVNGRPAQNGLDFARACAKLGVDRGIASFQRYAFLKRSGLAYLAVPLTRFWVRRRQEADLLDDLDRQGWLARFNHIAADAGQAVASAYRRIEEAMFQLCQHGGAARVQALLRELGRLERLLAERPGLRQQLPPLVLTSMDWWRRADDGSPEFTLAAGIAGLVWEKGPHVRAYFSPVAALRPGSWEEPPSPRVIWQHGDLVRNLVRLLERRLLDAEHAAWASTCPDGKPLHSQVSVPLPYVLRFLDGTVNDERLEALIWGLLPLAASGRYPRTLRAYRLRAIPRAAGRHGEASPGEGHAGEAPARPWVPWAYAVTKLVLTPDDRLAGAMKRAGHAETLPAEEGVRVPVPTGLVQTLASGDAGRLDRAVRLAERRLYASGFPLGMRGVSNRGLDPRRVLAAAVFPLSQSDLTDLVRRVAERPDDTQRESLTVAPPPDEAGEEMQAPLPAT
ncbi:hypothetical protein GCM10010885_11460 [Alicyclobacillus cellulosilyticus]|uniref:Type I-U CRISPR-associated protein Csx17 n=1 Tax=Alicyclobacillus cellulosilyticus TaxID=1003997 RepID=A0A917K9C3_9BACL|nr:type I-U CRISPR-associated protein Csx17 [Alicyclobacillus cellulosilyticus]GGJ03943.1 hypothetical protein GCM10010885_11460 [Alicyclobacillus cellulosilyticus]